MERSLVADIAGALAFCFAWFLANNLIIDLQPLAATGAILLFGIVFAVRFVLPTNDPAQLERQSRSRVRALGAQAPWAFANAIVVALFLLAFHDAYVRVFAQPVYPDSPLPAYLRLPFGWLPFFVAAVVVDPLVSEVIFRGWVQGSLQRRFGPETAIVGAAVLYAALPLLQLEPWYVPDLFLLGLTSGYSVYVTRSIWSGVMLNFVFSAGSDALDGVAIPGGSTGAAIDVGVMLAAALAAVAIWRRQRVIRDRTAAPVDEGPAGTTASD